MRNRQTLHFAQTPRRFITNPVETNFMDDGMGIDDCTLKSH
jgi:hypothetical protein